MNRYRKSFNGAMCVVAIVLAAMALSTGTVQAQTTSFTYQGRLTDGGSPANGPYDLQFALFDSGGTQIGSTLTRSGVAVSAGIFTVQLDFGAGAFPGATRFLEIGTRSAGVGSFTILTPRQQITATPYAVRSLNASAADTATNASQLGGVAASQYVQTSDSRLSDSRPPTAGSANYIQNTTSQQTANFNISGNGTVNGIALLGATGSVYGYLVPGSSPGPYPTIGFNTYGPGYQAGSAGYGGIFQFQNGDGRLIYYNGSNVAAGQPHTSLPLLTIDQSGGVSIGNNLGTSAKLSVNGGVGVFGSSTSDYAVYGSSSSGTGVASVSASGPGVYGFTASGIGVFGVSTGSGYAGYFNGNVQATGTVCAANITCASDARLKQNVRSLSYGLPQLLRLRPVSWQWKDPSERQLPLGLIAQEVERVIPELVLREADSAKPLNLNYQGLVPVLIKAIQEQQQQIEALRARLRAVEKNRRRKTGVR